MAGSEPVGKRARADLGAISSPEARNWSARDSHPARGWQGGVMGTRGPSSACLVSAPSSRGVRASPAGRGGAALETGNHRPAGRPPRTPRTRPRPAAAQATHADVVCVDVVTLPLALCPAQTDAALGIWDARSAEGRGQKGAGVDGLSGAAACSGPGRDTVEAVTWGARGVLAGARARGGAGSRAPAGVAETSGLAREGWGVEQDGAVWTATVGAPQEACLDRRSVGAPARPRPSPSRAAPAPAVGASPGCGPGPRDWALRGGLRRWPGRQGRSKGRGRCGSPISL